jgi:hypothetical protein
MGPLGGTQYNTYAANWTYDTCMPVLDIRTRSKGHVPNLGLTDEDVSLSKGGGLCHPDSRLNRIDRISIPLKYTFFFESPTTKNSEVKHA